MGTLTYTTLTDMTDLSHFPSPLTNNSREIVRKAIERYQENPNDRNAQTLENYGFSVDHDDYRDHDEPNRHYT